MDIINAKSPTSIINNFALTQLQTMQEGKTLSTIEGCKEISLQNVSLVDVEFNTEKPSLKLPAEEVDDKQLLSVLGQFALSNQAIPVPVFDESKAIFEKVFQHATPLDIAEIKQLPQIVGAIYKEALNNQVMVTEGANEVKSVNEVKSSQFVGIVSSDILLELAKIIRKVLSEVNISDRKISADFLMLNAKMVEAAAESTIKEGKEMMIGALAGFCTSMAISMAGAGFQLKSLRTQNQSIKNNLVKANQNSAIADRLNELNKSSNPLAKSNSLVLKGKDGQAIEMIDSPSASQQATASQRTAEAAQRTNKLSQVEYQKHDQIMNNERTKSSIAEQGARLADNAGQMATSANQINVKEEEANKMQQQSAADIARTVSGDKDKQIDKDKDLVKQMHEHLREIREGQLRTFQSVVRG
ncbi:type III secretion target, IpaC/SipC family protein [Providencia sp. Me31A]|uniref:type III secretion target, IpaC/SipC family protein n=1 Tax=Providencia sp. Me31A TaxID=3392637 RepID=UPI003D282F48